MLVEKCANHQRLNRQSESYAREGEPGRSTALLRRGIDLRSASMSSAHSRGASSQSPKASKCTARTVGRADRVILRPFQLLLGKTASANGSNGTQQHLKAARRLDLTPLRDDGAIAASWKVTGAPANTISASWASRCAGTIDAAVSGDYLALSRKPDKESYRNADYNRVITGLHRRLQLRTSLFGAVLH
jgi:hypothetical protein